MAGTFTHYWCICEMIGLLSGISGFHLCIYSTSLHIPQYFPRFLTIYNLTSDVKEFLLLYLLINAAYWQDSYLYPSGGSKMAILCSLNLCLLEITGKTEHLSICLFLYSLLYEMNIHIYAYLSVSYIFLMDLEEFFIYSGYLYFVGHMCCKPLLPVGGLFFYLL